MYAPLRLSDPPFEVVYGSHSDPGDADIGLQQHDRDLAQSKVMNGSHGLPLPPQRPSRRRVAARPPKLGGMTDAKETRSPSRVLGPSVERTLGRLGDVVVRDLVTAIVTGIDRPIETALVNASPQWLTDLTTRY